MEKVSVLIPTRQRYKKLAKCLSKLFENTVYPNYEVVVIADKDDPESVEVIRKLKFDDVKILVKEKREMYVGKINEGFHKTNFPLIVFLADDVEVNRNWLTEAVSTFNKLFPDEMGLVSFQDEYDDRLAPHGLISRKYVKEFLNGNIFHPKYIHYWCDVELTTRSKRWGRFAHCQKARYKHTRPNEKKERDHIYQEGLSTKKAGENMFILRQWLGFPNEMPHRLKLRLPKKVPLHFRPGENLYFYFGFGIDTRKKLNWTVERELGKFLLSGFPLNWESSFGPAYSPIKSQRITVKELKVDIIMPTYNRPNLLEKAVKSVLEQTSTDWELWIYDDGSDYDISSIMEKYKNRKIHFFSGPKLTQIQRENRGGAIVRNILLRKSKNELICYLDDDNYYWPEAIEKMVEYFKDYPDADVAFGKLTYSTPETEFLPKEKRKVRFFTQPVLNPFCNLDTSQVVHRRNCLQVGYWPEKTEQDLREDGFFFRQLAKYYVFHPVNAWLANFCEHKYSRHALQTARNYTARRE